MTAQAVLVIDLCGFSRLMEEQGVSYALGAVAQLQEAARNAAEAAGGRVVKCWADNVMAVFPTVRAAQRAADATLEIVTAAAGIGFGDVLDIGDDLYGVEVNNACRLGEDVAESGQVLLTEAARISVEKGGLGNGSP